MQGLKARPKLPLLRHPVKGGMALESPHPGRKQAEGDSATSVRVADAVDERRQFLSPVVIGCEQIRLMAASGHEVEQHDADAERFVHWSCARFVGLLWPWISRLGLGRLPGDVLIERGNFHFYFPSRRASSSVPSCGIVTVTRTSTN